MNEKIKELTDRIDQLLVERPLVLVAIDGSCTSGKSTLAEWIAERYDCNLFHMDDFFLRQHQRTPERFAEPGGNVDRERFAEEVLTPLMAWKAAGDQSAKAGSQTDSQELADQSAKAVAADAFTYRPYDCSVQRLGEALQVERKQLNIIEGSYSLHPELADAYDLKVLLTVDPEIRHERIMARPEFLHKRFFEEWIPMEQMYFNSSNITERCDIIIDTVDL